MRKQTLHMNIFLAKHKQFTGAQRDLNLGLVCLRVSALQLSYLTLCWQSPHQLIDRVEHPNVNPKVTGSNSTPVNFTLF